MTVSELIAALRELPSHHQVIVDLHSEWALAGKPILVGGYEAGGYISEPRTREQLLRAHGYVHIPVESER